MRLVSDAAAEAARAIRRAGVLVVIATDNMDCFTRWTVPALGLVGGDQAPFDNVLSSHTLGFLKADTDERGRSLFFGPFLETHGIAAEQSLLIDDSRLLEHVVRGFGMEYHRVEREGDLLRALTSIARSQTTEA